MSAPDAEAIAARLADSMPYTVSQGFHTEIQHPSRTYREQAAAALLPVVQAIAAETAADELDRAIREHRTTVAKLNPVERLTCILVKAEDLVRRAAELRGQWSPESRPAAHEHEWIEVTRMEDVTDVFQCGGCGSWREEARRPGPAPETDRC